MARDSGDYFLSADLYGPAIAEARNALELDDRNPMSHWAIPLSYFLQGKPAEARESAEEAFRPAPWSPGVVGILAGILAQAGERDRAEKLIATLPETSPGGMIIYHFLCSEIDAAIDSYERDIELRQPSSVLVAAAGFFKPLRASPRWPKLAKMMNLPGKA